MNTQIKFSAEKKNIVVGDIVERCDLLPATVTRIENDNVDMLPFLSNQECCCSLSHCGLRKITKEFAAILLKIGKKRLAELWQNTRSYEEYDKQIYNEYEKLKKLKIGG